MRRVKINLLITLVFCFHMISCGKTVDRYQSKTTIDKASTNNETEDQEEDLVHLEYYAKITSNIAPLTDDFTPSNIADGLKKLNERTTGAVWIPGQNKDDKKRSQLTMIWNSLVDIRTIHLFDNSDNGQQITKGKISFILQNQNEAIADFEFNELEDSGHYPLRIDGPEKPVLGFVIQILESTGDHAGLAEVEVFGKRINEPISNSNVIPHGRISNSSSLDKEVHYQSGKVSVDKGANRTEFIKDTNDHYESIQDTCWLNNNMGMNAFVEIEFDRSYLMNMIEINIPPLSIIEEITITFDDQSEITLSKSKDQLNNQTLYSNISKNPNKIVATKVKISITKISTTNTTIDTGLCGVTILANYQP